MRFRFILLSVAVVIMLAAALALVQRSHHVPSAARPDGRPAPSAAEEAGEITDNSSVRAQALDPAPAPAPKRALAPRPRSSRPSPVKVKAATPAARPNPASRVPQQRLPAEASGASPESITVETSPGSIPEASVQPAQPGDGATGPAQPEEAVNPGAPAAAAVLKPPVLLTFPAAQHPSDAYRIVLPSGTLTPQVVREALQGRVVLRILVLADGTVGRVEVASSSGNPVLYSAAVASARTWIFAPATRDGQPIDAWALITVRFTAP